MLHTIRFVDKPGFGKMKDISIEEVLSLRIQLETAQKKIAAWLETAPDGSITYKRIRGKLRCYKYLYSSGESRERYMHSDKRDEIIVLTKKRLYRRTDQVISDELQALDTFICNYHPGEKYRVYEEIPSELKPMVSPLFITMKEKCCRWQASEFESNTYNFEPEQCILTARGESVRSRAECIIADKLDRADLSYHYEQKLRLANGKTVYPDFTIMHPTTGEFYYMEFFGMMDDAGYAKAAFGKIRAYQTNGLAGRLIMVFDYRDVPFSTNALDEILSSYFGIQSGVTEDGRNNGRLSE